MAYSIEARVPFLDYRLVEYVLRLPPDFKIKDGVTKVLLRRAMKGTLPDLVSCRNDKLGFTTNTEVWMTKQLPGEFESLLRIAVGASGGLVRESIVDDFRSVCEGRSPFNLSYWRVICLGIWVRVYGVDMNVRA